MTHLTWYELNPPQQLCYINAFYLEPARLSGLCIFDDSIDA
jgi:hypothetical protein